MLSSGEKNVGIRFQALVRGEFGTGHDESNKGNRKKIGMADRDAN